MKRTQLNAGKVTLRCMVPGDTEDLTDLFCDPSVTRTYMVPEGDREKMRALAARIIVLSAPEESERFVYGICLNGRVIGLINDCGREGDTVELGYAVRGEERGRGYATLALRAAIAELGRQGVRKVTIGYFEENPASRRVAEKCGMTPSGREERIVYRQREHRCLYMEVCPGQGGGDD